MRELDVSSVDTNDEGANPIVLYRVRAGDDLQSIAMQFYGRRDFWVFLFMANPGDIHGLRGLPPGKLLRVPVLPGWRDASRITEPARETGG